MRKAIKMFIRKKSPYEINKRFVSKKFPYENGIYPYDKAISR